MWLKVDLHLSLSSAVCKRNTHSNQGVLSSVNTTQGNFAYYVKLVIFQALIG